MGAVYRAEQSRLGRTVAVKVLPNAAAPDSEARERFEREAQILSGLNHPHILHIHDFGALPDGTLYLVTEWAGGGDLSCLVNHEARPPALVLEWLRQIASALDAAHARGVIHRDLKPPNVLVHEDGRLTLADFGLAHAAGGRFAAALTLPEAVFGTFEYMAPEQMESAGHATPATDIYALGVMTYQMLTGRVPRGAYSRPSRLVRVPHEVDAVLDAAMASDPERRPKSAAEFVRALERALLAPVRRRQRQLIGLGVALVGLALAWARAEIIQAERDAAAAEARLAASQAEARLWEMRRALQAATELRTADELAGPENPLDLRLNPVVPPAQTSVKSEPDTVLAKPD
ncbi:MAG: Serine/threonine-protein kinase PknB [Verrucomicrobiota bacterium]|jgi:serine/threonine protein kinase